MADTSWLIKHYDKNGNDINANYSGYSDSGTTNTIAHATDRQLAFALNGVDSLNFSLYLDDPMAAEINRLTSFIKVWRTVPGYSDPSNTPCFAGIVGSHIKSGAQNIMRVTAYSPFWRLQFRFHLLNHYLKTNPDTSLDYRTSEVIMRLITFLSNAFGPLSYMGIEQGVFYDVATEIVEAPYFQPKGANAWAEIFDGLLVQASTIDLIPRYHHTSGNKRLMYLDTAHKRGSDISGSVTFSYRTATPSNLDDVTETQSVEPGAFANYVWAVGQGGPNSGKIAVAENNSVLDEGYGAIGVYQLLTPYGDIKRIGILGANPPATATGLRARALSDLARSIVPNLVYEVALSPAANIYYEKDFTLGDVINLNASKGALQISNVKQRLYEPTLSMSDNNIETVTLRVSKDFSGKVGN